MGLLDQWNLANDVNFQAKVRMAAINAAIAIVSEERAKGFDEYHNLRARLANTVLGVTQNVQPGGFAVMPTDTDVTVERIALAVATNPSIDAPSSDDDIQFTVNSMWDSLAGVPDDLRPEAV